MATACISISSSFLCLSPPLTIEDQLMSNILSSLVLRSEIILSLISRLFCSGVLKKNSLLFFSLLS